MCFVLLELDVHPFFSKATFLSCCIGISLIFTPRILGSGGRPSSITPVVILRETPPLRWLLNLSCSLFFSLMRLWHIPSRSILYLLFPPLGLGVSLITRPTTSVKYSGRSRLGGVSRCVLLRQVSWVPFGVSSSLPYLYFIPYLWVIWFLAVCLVVHACSGRLAFSPTGGI